MRPLHLLPRRFRPSRSTLGSPSALRPSVAPPSLCHAPDSLWQRLMFWLMAPAPQEAAPPLNRLPGVRADFLHCLGDVSHPDADGLTRRIELARSLRELWHLRAEVYRLVSINHDQACAELRLERLNRHFPARAPRSQFVSS